MAVGVTLGFVLGIFTVFLTYMDDLDKCAAPLGIWVVLEWILGFLQFLIAGCEGIRARLGRWGYFLFLLLVVWSFSGILMYVWVQWRSADCISDDVSLQFMCAMITIFLACSGFMVLLCIYGVSFFRRFFYAGKQLKEVLQAIQNGFIIVEDYITANPDIDTYCLFDFESKALKKKCRLTRSELDNILSAHQTADSVGLKSVPSKESIAQKTTMSERVCSICLEGLNSSAETQKEENRGKQSNHGLLPQLLASDPVTGVMKFPVCEHLYHEQCLLGWLSTKTSCPLCRGGIRSSLYRSLAPNQPRTAKSPSATSSQKSPPAQA